MKGIKTIAKNARIAARAIKGVDIIPSVTIQILIQIEIKTKTKIQIQKQYRNPASKPACCAGSVAQRAFDFGAVSGLDDRRGLIC